MVLLESLGPKASQGVQELPENWALGAYSVSLGCAEMQARLVSLGRLGHVA